MFSPIDLVDLVKIRQKISGALFRDIWGQSETFKEFFLKLQKFTLATFLYYVAVLPIYHCAKIHSLSSSNKLSREMRVFVLSRFLAHFSFFLSASKSASSYLEN